MNHQPFEAWLHMREELSPEQEAQLRQHLAECASCQTKSGAWLEVESVLHTSQLVPPRPGFAARWQERLAFKVARERRRRSWLWLGLLTSGVLGLAFLVAGQLWVVLESPAQAAATWLRQLNVFLEGFRAAQGVLETIVAALGKPSSAWALLVLGLYVALSGVWVGLMFRLTLRKRWNGVTR